MLTKEMKLFQGNLHKIFMAPKTGEIFTFDKECSMGIDCSFSVWGFLLKPSLKSPSFPSARLQKTLKNSFSLNSAQCFSFHVSLNENCVSLKVQTKRTHISCVWESNALYSIQLSVIVTVFRVAFYDNFAVHLTGVVKIDFGRQTKFCMFYARFMTEKSFFSVSLESSTKPNLRKLIELKPKVSPNANSSPADGIPCCK